MRAADSVGFSLFKGGAPRRAAPSVWLVALAGAAQALSLSWPWSMPELFSGALWSRGDALWWLQLLALSLLVDRLQKAANAAQAAVLGWVFGLSWLACTFAWLYVSMHRFGGMPAPMAVASVVALAAALSLYYALACAVFFQLQRRSSWLSVLVFAAVWTLAELGRGVVFTGFGWGATAYAHIDGPLAPWLAWVGVYGVGALAAAAAVLLAGSPKALARSMRAGLAHLGLIVLLLGSGAGLPAPSGQSAGVLAVSLLQGNIGQGEKFDNGVGVPMSLDWYGAQLLANDSTLVITPETALPVLPAQLPEGYWQRLRERYASGHQAALIGMPMGSLDQGYSNSVVGLQPGQGQSWRYDKHHLVPFGEFIPPWFRWFTELMNIPLGDFQRGGLPQATFNWAGQRIATLVCFETLFSEELVAHFRSSSSAPTILANVSNLAWFGENLAMDQHLNIARARALELSRPLLLASNTGVTAIVDHQGKVVQRAPSQQAFVLRGQVEGRSGLTPYARWLAAWGLWPLLALALLVLGASWVVARR